MKLRTVILGIILLASLQVTATTWNEPWHEEVVRLSDIFVKVKITETSESRATAVIVKDLGGTDTGRSITIQGFSNLQIGSTSGHTHELDLPFKVGNEYYLLLKRDAKSERYQLPTPTSGWAFVENNNVYATYRHSYHKALVPADIYEKTMLGIFSAAKGKTVSADVPAFVKEQLSMLPGKLGSVEDAETKRFFLQHVALETFYHTGLGADRQLLEPFITFSEPQVQTSAARAIGRLRSKESQERLMKFIESDGAGFAKVMCVWALADQDARQLSPRLQAFEKKGKDQETGFGGSIMDPRVGTFFPSSVKGAVRELLAKWGIQQK